MSEKSMIKQQKNFMVPIENRIYICIDLKTFYASVECVERGLDPMTTNLIVADKERSEKTICLAVSPAMKALGPSRLLRTLCGLWNKRRLDSRRQYFY